MHYFKFSNFFASIMFLYSVKQHTIRLLRLLNDVGYLAFLKEFWFPAKLPEPVISSEGSVKGCRFQKNV
jgi:hypothetical protein